VENQLIRNLHMEIRLRRLTFSDVLPDRLLILMRRIHRILQMVNFHVSTEKAHGPAVTRRPKWGPELWLWKKVTLPVKPPKLFTRNAKVERKVINNEIHRKTGPTRTIEQGIRVPPVHRIEGVSDKRTTFTIA